MLWVPAYSTHPILLFHFTLERNVSNNKSLAAIEKQRKTVYQSMTKATREVADEFEASLTRGARGVVLIQYDLGKRVIEITKEDNESKYGSNAVEQLASYLSIPGGSTTLYALKSVAETFDKGFIDGEMQKTLTGGGNLQIAHWIALAKVEDQKDRKALLAKVFAEGWSANDLELEVRSGVRTKHARSGGRRPGVPTSPIAGLQKTYALLHQLNNWESVAVKHVFKEIDGITPDAVTKAMIEKLQVTKKEADTAAKNLTAMIEHLVANIERANEVLEEKYKQAEENRQEIEGEKKSKGKGKPKAKKSSRPRAATAAA